MTKLKSLPRPLRWLIGIASLYGVTFITGFALTWVHYLTTDDFATYIQKYPVSQSEIDDRLLEGELIDSGESLAIGDLDPFSLEESDQFDVFRRKAMIEIDHGLDNLLAFEFEMAVAEDLVSRDRAGVTMLRPKIRTGAGLKSIATVGLLGVDEMVGPNSESVGVIYLDILLVAGSGDSETRFVHLNEHPVPLPTVSPTLKPFVPAFFGFLHPLGSPPEEGLIYRTRLALFLDWKKLPNGSQGASLHAPSMAMGSNEYSWEVRTTVEDRDGKMEAYQSLDYKWNDQVW